jgi:N-acetyl-beta-hexosaminidase
VYELYIRTLVAAVNGDGLGRRTAMGWADIDDAFPGVYSGAPDDVILAVWTGFYGGNWQDDVAALVARNASLIVSGPFYVSATDRSESYPHNSWEKMYAQDLSNFTGAAPDNFDRVLGGELTVWGDAAQVDTQNVLMTATPNLFAVAESWWSPRSVTSGVAPSGAQPRMSLHRCRVAQRGVPSNAVYSFGAAYEPWGGQCPYAEWAYPLPL